MPMAPTELPETAISPQDRWRSPQIRDPGAGLGAGAGERALLGRAAGPLSLCPAVPLSPCAGSAPALPAPAPGRAKGDRERNFFFVTISTSFPPPAKPSLQFLGAACWWWGCSCLHRTGGEWDPRGDGCAAREASPNSRPPPCGPAVVPAAPGSSGAVSPPLVSPGGLGQRWDRGGVRGPDAPRGCFGEGSTSPRPAPPAPSVPLQHPAGERTGLAQQRCGGKRTGSAPGTTRAAFQGRGHGRAPRRGWPPHPSVQHGAVGGDSD